MFWRIILGVILWGAVRGNCGGLILIEVVLVLIGEGGWVEGMGVVRVGGMGVWVGMWERDDGALRSVVVCRQACEGVAGFFFGVEEDMKKSSSSIWKFLGYRSKRYFRLRLAVL